MKKTMTVTQKKYNDFNLVEFKSEFICAGVRDNILGMYNFLIEKGAQVIDKETDKQRISSKKPIVLLCKNAVTDPRIGKTFAKVQIMEKNWWDYYHNRQRKTCRTTIRTYNLPSQWNIVLMVGCIWKEVEVLIPEVV